MESYSVQAVLSVTDRGFTGTMNKAVSSLSELDSGSKKTTSSIMKIASGIGVFKALDISVRAVSNSVGAAVERFDTMNRFPKVMAQVGFGAKESEASIQKLSDGIKGLPTSLNGITASTQKIALLTNDLNKATNTSLALNNAFLASGSAAADAERGMIQYTQMLSKGTVDMQSWRTLQETMGPALYSLAEAFGFAGQTATNDLYAAIQSGQVTFTELNDKLVELDGGVNGFAERAKTASAGIGTSLSNMRLSVVRGLEGTIRALDSGLANAGLPTVQEAINTAATKIDSAFKIINGGISAVVSQADILIPALGTAATAFVAFHAAMKIQDTIKTVQKAMEGAKVTIDAYRNAEQLATQAMQLSERAIRMRQTAENLNAKAKEASVKAINSEQVATVSSIAATNAKTVAEKAAVAETRVRNAEENLAKATMALRAKEEAAAAAVTKSKAAQEKAAAGVTKAKEAVDKKALALEQARTKAAGFGASASELSAKAETLDAAATKAKAKADSDSVGVTAAKASAEKADTFATEASAAADAKGAAATEAGNIVTAKSSILVIAKTAVLSVLSGELGIVAAAQWAWNAAMTANPLGAATVAVAAFATAIVGVVKVLDNLDTKTKHTVETTKAMVDSAKKLTDTVESNSKAYKDNAADLEASTKANQELIDKITTLSQKEGKSAQEKAELKTYVDSLNASVDGLNLQYSKEADALNMTTEAIAKKVEAYEIEAKAQAAQARYPEVLKEKIKVDEELNNVVQRKKDLETEYLEGMNGAPAAIGRYNQAAQGLNQTETELNQKKRDLAQSEEYLKDVMVESQTAQSEAVNSSVQSQVVTMESLSESQQAVVQSLNETWQSYADQATNMFDVLSDESELSVAQMTANLEENQRVIGNWATNIEALATRGIDQGLLEQLRQAGPESAGYVNAMVQASDAELQQLSAAFTNGGTTATTALKTAFDLSAVPESAIGLIVKTKDSMAQQIAAADFGSIGKNIADTVTTSIGTNSAQAGTAATNLGTTIKEGTANELGIHSPSTVYMGYGANTIQGYVLGVQSQQGTLNASMQNVMNSAGQVAVAAMNNSLANIANISLVSFSKIPAAAQTSMSATASAITAGMSAGNNAVNSGMRNMQTTTSSGMKAINLAVQSNMKVVQATAEAGMQQFVRSIDTGMSQANTSVSRGNASIISTLSRLRSSFYDSGYFASLGLANGINTGAGAAISAAERLANNIANTMRKALDINSPSKVTTQIGEYAGIGSANGILSMIPKVQSASDKLAEAMIPNRTSDLTNRIHYGNHENRYSVNMMQNTTAAFDSDYIIEGLKAAISELNIQVQAVISAKETGNAAAPYVDNRIGMRTAMRERYL